MITVQVGGQAVTVEKSGAGRLSFGYTDLRAYLREPPVGSVLHAMYDRIAELEALVADRGPKLAALAAYEAPPLETEADGFICELALQHGAEMLNDDGSTYAFNEVQLLAYTKANRAGSSDQQALAADGALFRRVHAAMTHPTDSTFADNMDRLTEGRTDDDAPTLDELRDLLREALAGVPA